MKQHQRRGARRRRLAEDLARMHDARVERADRQDRRAQDPMLRVEQQHAELLDRAVAVLRQQVLGHALRTCAAAAGLRPTRVNDRRPELDRREHLRGARGADPGHPLEARRGAARTSAAQPARGEHRVGQIQRAGVRAAVPEHDRQQLVVAERAGAEPLELFARPIVRRDGLHANTRRRCYTSSLMRRLVRHAVCRSALCSPHARLPPRKNSTGPRARSTPRAPPAPSSTPRRNTPPPPPRCSRRTTPSPSATTGSR